MNKVVVVTGAGRGLGLSICETLLANGYHVAAISRSQTAELDELLAKHKERLSFYAYDLQHTDGIAELSKTIINATKHDGRPAIYGLVNNAAIGSDGVLGTMHEAEIVKMIAINVTAPILLTKYFSRVIMLSGMKGRIINIGSIIGSTGYSGLSVYGATKAAMEGFSRSLSREIGKIGMTVNVVAPGYMETSMTDGLQGEKLESIRRRSAMKMFARPQDVAQMVDFLLGPGGERVTGTVLTVDAGSTA